MKMFSFAIIGLLAFSPLMAQESAEQGDSQVKDSARMAHRARLVKRFDKDGDGKLNDEEKAAMDRFIEARRNNTSREGRGARHARREEILKKYDKDEDGKLSDEERKAMLEERAKRHPGGAKRGGRRQSSSED